MSNEYGPLLYQGADKGVDLLKVFPLAFTMACCLLFLMPFVKCVDLAFDSNVVYFMGTAVLRILLFFPIVLILLAHFIHWRSQRPNKYAFVLGTIGPAVCFLVLGERVLSEANGLGFRFLSEDCGPHFHKKYQLEQSYQAARSFYDTCVPMTPEHPNLSPIITECSGYQVEMNHRPAWRYLQHLESRYTCAGWCTSEVPLWALSNAPRDPCSRVVGQVMRTSILPQALQVFVYSILVIVVAVVGLLVLGPKIRLVEV